MEFRDTVEKLLENKDLIIGRYDSRIEDLDDTNFKIITDFLEEDDIFPIDLDIYYNDEEYVVGITVEDDVVGLELVSSEEFNSTYIR